MAGETSTALRRSADLARRAAADLGRQAVLALADLAGAEGLASVAAGDPLGLPLVREDPFGVLAGQPPGSDVDRASSPAGRSPASAAGVGGLRSPAALSPASGRGGTSAWARVPPGSGDVPPSTLAAQQPAGVRDETSQGGRSDPVLRPDAGRATAPSASATEGPGLDRLTDVVAGAGGRPGGETAQTPLSGGRPAVGSAAPSGTPGTPRDPWREGDRRPTEGGPGQPSGPGFEPASRAAPTPGEAGNGGSARLGSLWGQLAELAEEALRGGPGREARRTAPLAGRVPGANEVPASPSDLRASGGTPVASSTAAAAREAVPPVVQAAWSRAAAALAAAPIAPPGATVPGGVRAEAPGVRPLDPDELAELVSDALVRQARRHGVDLS